MKLQPILIGIAAGIAAALLFLAPIGATLIAFPLFLLTGLPIAIAALGWGLVGGAAATLTASVVIGVVLPILPPVVIFLVVFGIPIVWLARLAGMWRETDAADPASPREWYPLGRILLHAAIAAAIGLTAIGFFFGYDPVAIGGAAQEALTLALADLQPGQPPPTPETVRAFVELYVAILPATLALMIVLAMVVNLYLGSRIARASGRMQRPPEHMWMVELPGVATIVFGIALVVAFLPGTIGQVGGIVAGAFGAALVLVGLAVAHAITFGIAGRGALLGLLYVLIVISGLPLILVALAGIGESVLRLRARRFAGRGVPPT